MSISSRSNDFELQGLSDKRLQPHVSHNLIALDLLSRGNEVQTAANRQTLETLPQLSIEGEKGESKKFLSEQKSEGTGNQSKGESEEDKIAGTQRNVSDSIGKISPQTAALFDKYSKQFADRAVAQGIKTDEQLKVYKSLEQMVQAPDNSGAKMSLVNRAMVALDFMYHAADPSTIDQGIHDTCSVSTIEEQMFVRQPSKVADLVAQVLLKGNWRAGDGKTIEIDEGSLVPGTEESSHPPTDGQRSLVSQIFQVTVLNDIAQRGELGGYLGQSVRYCENDGHSFVQLSKDRPAGEFLGISDDVMQAELSRLSSEKFPSVFINSERDHGTFRDVSHFNSPEQFQVGLSKMKAENELPAIIGVYSNLPPFSDPGGGGHVLCITDIRKDADGSYKVFVDNQWGKVGAGSDGWYALNDIFNATKRS
ncbi:MAG: hypothetical protein K2X81_02195 [Candidatus Obscuribacterales bacterium]|nr:hypothetical protein [Candidatus Obscuribacterales bacterium]